jgi:hypothetical protein
LTFTTDDDSLDEFCVDRQNVVCASANREPLRTPSIQSPQVDTGAFPWTKALHTSPQRTLSAIPDTYEEDLFENEKYSKLGESWFSGHATTPSLASVLDSAYGSLKSLAIKPAARRNPPRPDPVAIPSSLPTRPSRPMPTMSSVFGKKDTVAKSWNEMFEEDEEESEREQAELRARREMNSRTWSQDSRKLPVPAGVLTESKSRSSSNARRSRTPKPLSPSRYSGFQNENDPFGWKSRQPPSPRQVPADKWAALGEKRRNFQTEPDNKTVMTKKRSMTTGSRKRPANQHDNWYRRDSRANKHRPAFLDQDWRMHKVVDSSNDEDDHEWVGGWRTFHE